MNWGKYFDHIYCLHYLPDSHKMPRLLGELARVGILDSEIFEFRYTTPSPYDKIIWEKNTSQLAPKPLFVNICLEVRKCLAESLAFGYKRILLLENDICFLKDLDEIEKGFADTPAGFGVVQYDKFVDDKSLTDYKERLLEKKLNDFYFDGRGGFFSSAACMGLFEVGISEMLRVMDERICATDIAPQLMKCPYAIAIKNLSIQLFYAGSNSIDDYGAAFMHNVYKNAEINYEDYAVPEGYGYSSVIDSNNCVVNASDFKGNPKKILETRRRDTIVSIKWTDYFDRIFVVHQASRPERIERLRTEIKRVGILDSGILEYEVTVPTFIEEKYWGILPEKYRRDRLNPVGALNLTIANERIFRKSLLGGYRRILVLEDDVQFLSDTAEIKRMLDRLPQNYDFCQFDKVRRGDFAEQYKDLKPIEGTEGAYLGLEGAYFYATTCNAYSQKAMSAALDSLSKGYSNIDCVEIRGDIIRIAAVENMAIQYIYPENMSNITLNTNNTQAQIYGSQGIDLTKYGVKGEIMPQEREKGQVKRKKYISVYAIAKDEAKYVRRWFECMKEADEVCVLDTGSTDDTVKILKELGAKVEVKKYDTFLFDKARNDARKLVSKDSEILFALDLDETIAPGWRRILEDAWIDAEERGVSPAYAEYKFKSNMETGETTYINKIHSATEGKWVYGIHEALIYDRDDHIILPETFCLEHHPDKQKSRGQYLGMLKSAVYEMPDSARMRLYYGRELANNGHFGEALREFEVCLEKSDKAPCDIDSVQRAVVMYYMAKIYLCKKNLDNAEMWCLRSVLECRRRDNCFLLGRLYDARGLVRLANSAYEKALTIKERQRGYPEEPEAWNGLLYGCYAKTLWALGQLGESKRMAEEAHRIEPENKDYVNLLNEINQKMPQPAAK